jgi:hypothetical protein
MLSMKEMKEMNEMMNMKEEKEIREPSRGGIENALQPVEWPTHCHGASLLEEKRGFLIGRSSRRIHNTRALGLCLPFQSARLQRRPGLQSGSRVNGERWAPIEKRRPPAKVFVSLATPRTNVHLYFYISPIFDKPHD